MIVERRAHTFRPGQGSGVLGRPDDVEQRGGLRPDPAAEHQLFSTITGNTDQVVHLCRFASPDHWRDTHEAYHRAQNPEYFALVRPMIVRQENALLMAPPIAGLAAAWLGETAPRLPPDGTLPAGADPATLCIVETRIDFFAGGLPIFWDAWRRHPVASRMPARGARLAGLMTLVGRLHRVFRYDAFATLDDAQAHAGALATGPDWVAYVQDYSAWVAGSTTQYLRPVPLPSGRSLFDSG